MSYGYTAALIHGPYDGHKQFTRTVCPEIPLRLEVPGAKGVYTLDLLNPCAVTEETTEYRYVFRPTQRAASEGDPED